ncbi:MAG TPA: 50S ribosomal protein L15 [Candidatus Magasanikbacteria bacterium]|nr:50S ribosomal protein L15 [Candidatus Magasanikbacteria bacterium]
MLTPSTISSRGRKRNTKRVGRGNGSGKGSYSTRGVKGQKARTGASGIMRRAFKAQLQKVPKSRGFTSSALKPETVSLTQLNTVAATVSEITPYVLKAHGIINNVRAGVKVVGTGELTQKVVLHDCLATKTALQAIEKAGGKLVL